MITKTLNSLLAMGLQSAAGSYGCLPIKDLSGRTWYAPGNWAFPASRAASVTLVPGTEGISVGTGNTPATDEDFQLENTITAGITLLLSATELGCDPPSNPWVLYKITITNTRTNPVTIKEVGYKQKLKGCKVPTGTSASDVVCLIDRTVLDSPVTIQGGDAGVIYYKLRTNPTASRTVSGVDIVSWEWGTDAQIADILDAAKAGTIDLQRDAGWRVGDIRMVPISAFTGGGSVSHAAQTVPIAIASFEEYEGCGNVMQIDFFDALAAGNRMNPTSTNEGGYGASEMYTTTLPALVEALPSWLSSRLRTFSVKASAGQMSTTIETVTGNKLALRSEVEIFGAVTNSVAGEGQQVDLYKITSVRSKTSPSNYWWERSPAAGSSGSFCAVGSGGPASGNASSARGVSPFGCI